MKYKIWLLLNQWNTNFYVTKCFNPTLTGMVEELEMKKLWLREFGVNIKLDSKWICEIGLIRQQTDQNAQWGSEIDRTVRSTEQRLRPVRWGGVRIGVWFGGRNHIHVKNRAHGCWLLRAVPPIRTSGWHWKAKIMTSNNKNRILTTKKKYLESVKLKPKPIC